MFAVNIQQQRILNVCTVFVINKEQKVFHEFFFNVWSNFEKKACFLLPICPIFDLFLSETGFRKYYLWTSPICQIKKMVKPKVWINTALKKRNPISPNLPLFNCSKNNVPGFKSCKIVKRKCMSINHALFINSFIRYKLYRKQNALLLILIHFDCVSFVGLAIQLLIFM